MAGRHIHRGADEIESIPEGFAVVHRMRLRAQMNAAATGAGSNRLDRYTVNDMDRQLRSQAFTRQAFK